MLESIRGPLDGLDGTRCAKAIAPSSSTSIARAAGAAPARSTGRRRGAVARRVYGITDSAADGLFGGWAQHIYLEPGVVIARLPDAVGVDDYIGGGCGLLTAVHIIERAALQLGETVLVQGAGAVGLSAIALARLAGASTIFAIGDPAARLALAREMGADDVFSSGRDDGGGTAARRCAPRPAARAPTS